MQAKAPRHGRKVTIETLEALHTTQASHVLYCRKCQAEYSADVADYFWARAGKAFKCCKVNNLLLSKSAHSEPSEPDAPCAFHDAGNAGPCNRCER